MKLVIAISNSSNQGKTETLRFFANLLLATYKYKAISPNPAAVHPDHDFRLVIEINGKIIGIESQGDPGTSMHRRLLELVNMNCDIILCTARTRGETVWAVNDLHNTKGYERIWTSTYQIEDKTQHNHLNELKAKHLLGLIKSLGLL